MQMERRRAALFSRDQSRQRRAGYKVLHDLIISRPTNRNAPEFLHVLCMERNRLSKDIASDTAVMERAGSEMKVNDAWLEVECARVKLRGRRRRSVVLEREAKRKRFFQ